MGKPLKPLQAHSTSLTLFFRVSFGDPSYFLGVSLALV
jgi:hypothetical protein